MRRYSRLPLSMVAFVAVACMTRENPPADSTTPAIMTVTEAGIGPLRSGMTVAEAKGVVREFTVTDAANSGCEYATVVGLPAGVSVMVEKGIVVRIDVAGGGVPTADGIRVGDSEQSVSKTYGLRVAVSRHKYTNGHYLTVRPASPFDTLRRLIFETDSGRIVRYRSGRLPQVAYVEGCS